MNIDYKFRKAAYDLLIKFVIDIFWCVDSEVETPDPIPNSAVKHFIGESSARETWCEASKMHLILKNLSYS